MNDINDVYHISLKRLTDKILPAESILIVPHDFPDPDSIGAAVGLQHLFKNLGTSQCDIAFSGFIGRAENRAMIEKLEINSFTLQDIDVSKYDRMIVVDSLPNNGNVSIPDVSIVDAVVDHHPVMELDKHENTLYEIHTDVGATSTLVTLYLLLSAIDIPPRVATALFYGMKTDTNDMARNCHEVDIICYKKLFDLIDHTTLSHIESPQRDTEYFQLLHSAAEDLRIYGDVAYSHLGVVTVPDYVPEMADIFHSLRDIEWMICSAIFSDVIIFSIRSKQDLRAGIRARKLARTFNGSGGGHPTMAAGRISIHPQTPEEAQAKFRSVVEQIFEISECKPKQIVMSKSL